MKWGLGWLGFGGGVRSGERSKRLPLFEKRGGGEKRGSGEGLAAATSVLHCTVLATGRALLPGEARARRQAGPRQL